MPMDHQQNTLTPHTDGKTVQAWLQSIGATETTYPASIGRSRMTAPWNPAEQWNGSDTKGTFFARYGHYNEGVHGDESPENPHLYSAGNFAGEKAAGSGGGLDDAVLAAIRKATGNPGLFPSEQDLEDLRLVKDPEGQNPVFLTRILPMVGGAQGTGGDQQDGAATPAHAAPHGKPVGPAAPAGDGEDARVIAARGSLSELKAHADIAIRKMDAAQAHGPWANLARDLAKGIQDAYGKTGL